MTTNPIPPDAVVAVNIDGNMIAAAVVSISPRGQVCVHALRTIELPGPILTVDRVVHPIFMDVDFIDRQNDALAAEGLRDLFSDPRFRRPVVAVYPAGMAPTHVEADPAAGADLAGLQATCAAKVRAPNPYAYPRLVSIDNTPPLRGGTRARAWWTRFDDILLLAGLFQDTGVPFLGFTVGWRALEEIIAVCREVGQTDEHPTTIVETGKLWTHYVGAQRGQVLFNHAIPVGLMRDGIYYFKSFSPTISELDSINYQVGSLLFPPDATPSPLFDMPVSTPQVDCTRYCLQVARYSQRVQLDIWAEEIKPILPVTYYLCGAGSRVPGMRQYVEARTGMHFRRLDRRPLPGLTLGEGVNWPAVADHLLPVGAAIGYHHRGQSRWGLVLRDRRPRRVEHDDLMDPGLDCTDSFLLGGPPEGPRGGRVA